MVLTVADAKKLTVARLKEELVKRGLSDNGNKPDLLARLVDAIEQAADDSILNDGGDLPLPGDDSILNDDILDAPSIDGDVDADKLLNGSTDAIEETPISTTTQPSETEAVKSPEDAKLARAARFGLPITGTVSAAELGSDKAKEARAARFGTTTPATPTTLTSENAKAARAARFGIETSTETKDKLAARAARFGIPVTGDGKRTNEISEEEQKKREERAKRFGLIDEDAEAKKKARLERFGAQ